MFKLDLIDKKVITYLNSNIRATYSEIAKYIRSSKEVVNYRIKKLEQNNIIIGYTTIFDFAYWSYKLLISFSKIDEVSEEKILNYLKGNRYITWLTPCTGSCDLFFAVFARSPKEFDFKLREILQNIGSYIQKYEVAVSVYSKTFGHNLILDTSLENKNIFSKKANVCNNINNNINDNINYNNANNNSEFDKKDKDIARIIKNNSRIRLIDICKETNINVDTIKYRIKKMQENGIIKRYRLLLDVSKLGYYRYEIFLKCINLSTKIIDKFEEYSRVNKNIEFFCRCVGAWDIEFTIYFESLKELKYFIFDIKKEFGNYIQGLKTVILFNTYNFIYIPKELD
jgi:DNA-binding Lrp family transcriptional regulator